MRSRQAWPARKSRRPGRPAASGAPPPTPRRTRGRSIDGPVPRPAGFVLANSSPEIVVGGKHLKLSNLDKVLYPAVGFTKAQVIDYYVKVAPYLLPHLRGRPLTLKRYPEGVEG